MTGPIDTEAKRRQAKMAALDCALAGVEHELINDVIALCDALDASRAERDEWKRLREDSLQGWSRASAMLRMAEQQREEYSVRLDILRKRISEALGEGQG